VIKASGRAVDLVKPHEVMIVIASFLHKKLLCWLKNKVTKII
jgi:hypothetical protein